MQKYSFSTVTKETETYLRVVKSLRVEYRAWPGEEWEWNVIIMQSWETDADDAESGNIVNCF